MRIFSIWHCTVLALIILPKISIGQYYTDFESVGITTTEPYQGGSSTEVSPVNSPGRPPADPLPRQRQATPDAAFTVSGLKQCISMNNFAFTPATSLNSSYNWDFGDGTTSTAITPSHKFSATGNYPVKLVCTNAEGFKDSTIQYVLVYPDPVINMGSAANYICQGSPALITASGGTTYEWYLNGTQITGSFADTLRATSAGTYSVVAIDDNGCRSQPSSPFSLTMVNRPDASFTYSGGCLGSPTTFKGPVDSSGNGLIYFWAFPTGATPVSSDPVIMFPKAGAYNVFLSVTSQACPSLTDTKLELVFINPKPEASFSVSNTRQCLSSNNFLFTPLSSTNINYTWKFGDGTSSNTMNPSHQFTTVGVYPVQLVCANSSGCKDSSTQFVTITADPIVSLTSAVNYICEGSSALLSASGGSTYEWALNGIALPASNTNSISATSAGSYSVVAIDSYGCKSQASSPVNLSLIQKPVADFSCNTTCVGMLVNLVNTSSGSVPVSYKWDFGNGTSSTAQQPAIAFNSPGNYNIQLTVTPNTCSNLQAVKSLTLKIDSPVPGITYPPKDAVENTPLQLSARNFGSEYNWSPATYLNSSSSLNPVYTGTQETVYKITIKTNAGCITVDTQLVRISRDLDIKVPTAFTPNGDGLNDNIFPFLLGVRLRMFRIINRWGVVVFESVKDLPGWDGRYRGVPQPMDGYVWEAEAADSKGLIVRRKGTLTLIR